MSYFTDWIATITTDERTREWAAKSEERHTRAMRDLLVGAEIDPASYLKIVEHLPYAGLVAQRNIEFSSLCQHHFLPFGGTLDLVYEPDNFLFGAGKLPRVVDALARRPQLQESLNRDIANVLMEAGARGVYVRSRAQHDCMKTRGPRAFNTVMHATYAAGTLRDSGRLQEIALALDTLL